MEHRRFVWAAAFALVAGVAGCDCGSGSGSDASMDGGTDSGIGSVLTSIYYEPDNPAASNNPFPGDYITVADPSSATGLRIEVPLNRGYPYAPQLNTLDGFSTTFGVYVRATRALDLTTTSADTMAIYPYDPAGSGTVTAIDGAMDEFGNETTLHFQTHLPLSPGTQYLVVVRSGGLLDFEGLPLGRSNGFQASIDAGDEIVSYLTDRVGASLDNVLHAHTFTTGTGTLDLVRIRESLLGAPPNVSIVAAFPPRDAMGNLHPELLARLPPLPPDLPFDSLETDDIGVIAYGILETSEFRSATGAWIIDPATGIPVPQGTLMLDFVMTLPLGATGNVPMVVFSHALGVCKETMIAMADVLAEYGMGAIGIDAVGHGSRAVNGSCGKNVDLLDILDPLDLIETRDNFRQTASDQIHLFRAVLDAAILDPVNPVFDMLPWTGDLATSGDGVSDFLEGPTAIIGQSLGSFMAGISAGIEPDVRSAVLNVGGLSLLGALPPSIAGKASIETATAAVTLLEPGDPWPYAHRFIEPFPELTGGEPKSVLLQMAYNDDTIPNDTTIDHAIELGAPLITPAPAGVADFGTGTLATPVMPASPPTVGLFAYDPVEHEFLLLAADFMNPGLTLSAQLQATVFLWTTVDPSFSAPVIIDADDPAQLMTFMP